MVKLITWVRLIYNFMMASFVRITRILRYISEFTRYASLVNKGNSSHTKFKTLLIHVECLRNTIKAMPSSKAKEKYRGVFEIQKSGDKTSSGEIGLDIRTHASPKVGQDQVSGGVSVLCWHAAPVADVLWKPCTIR